MPPSASTSGLPSALPCPQRSPGPRWPTSAPPNFVILVGTLAQVDKSSGIYPQNLKQIRTKNGQSANKNINAISWTPKNKYVKKKHGKEHGGCDLKICCILQNKSNWKIKNEGHEKNMELDASRSRQWSTQLRDWIQTSSTIFRVLSSKSSPRHPAAHKPSSPIKN